MDRTPAPDPVPLSIGDLAEATGLGVETLRAWERRYGRPVPRRLPSGHRRYDAAEVPWLRRVAEAVALGHRPSSVVALDDAALDRLLAAAHPDDGDAGPTGRWLAHVRRLDGPRLERDVARAATSGGAPAFLDDVLVPFLRAVGRRWAEGRLSIRHEHFATEVVAAVLARLRRRGPPRGRPPVVLLATLPGEHHGLGLLAAALAVEAGGGVAKVLGADTPADEVVAAAREARAAGVAVAVSSATGGPDTDRELAGLAAALPPGTPLLAGGEGMRGPRRPPKEVRVVPSFRALAAWVAERTAGAREPRAGRRGARP